MIMNNFHKSIVTGVKKAYDRAKELSNEEKT